MPRRPNPRPTHIYWLIDIRPEIIAAGWSNGQPFYCGKTVHSLKRRLSGHFTEAKLGSTTRPVLQRLRECGELFVRVRTMEIVPLGVNWAERERHWIELLRFSFPGTLNLADGGQGAAGFIQSKETIEKKAKHHRGKTLSPEHREKIRRALTGIERTPEWRERISRGNAGKVRTMEDRQRRSETLRTLWRSEEYRDKVIKSRTGRTASSEHRAAIKAGLNRPETRAKRSAIAATKRHSPETREKMSLAQQKRRAAESANV